MKDWDLGKKKAFTKAMKRPSFSKGGMIRKLANRHYFDAGGNVPGQDTALTGPTTAGTQNAANPNTGILGTIGGALGLNNNFQATGANIQAGTNQAQLNQAYNQAQQGIGQQQGLAGTLTPQAAQGVASQNALAQQLYGMTQGQGPNPAQAQLAQTTGQNVAQQAALAAGQRGAAGNVGLMARQNAMNAGQVQQAAAGQAATLEAQQQIAAQQNLANLAGTQIGQAGQAIQGVNTAVQNEQNTLQGANTAANQAQVGMQSNINATNASTAQAQQGTMGKLLGGVGSAISGVLGGLSEGGVVGQDEKEHHIKLAEMNAASIMHGRQNYAPGGQISANPLLGNQTGSQAQAPVSSAQYTAPTSGGGGFSVSGAPSAPSQGDSSDNSAFNSGIKGAAGAITNYFTGNGNLSPGSSALSNAGVDATSDLGMEAISEGYAGGGKVCEGPHGHVAHFLMGGKVPAMVSPGEIYLSPDQVHKVVHEDVDPAKIGRKFSGKAKVKGDSLKNDTIPADLEEGGVVIDRKNMSTKDKRRAFVHRAVARAKVRK